MKKKRRGRKRQLFIYERRTIPSEVKLLYKGFQELLSKSGMLETLISEYGCLVSTKPSHFIFTETP